MRKTGFWNTDWFLGLVVTCIMLLAAGSEVAQALFTQSRQGDLLDGLADIAGAATALWLAHKVSAAKKQAV